MNDNSMAVIKAGFSNGISYLVSQSRSKSGGILNVLEVKGISEASRVAEALGCALFAVDVGPGSCVEVWNSAWNRKLASAKHVSKYAA